MAKTSLSHYPEPTREDILQALDQLDIKTMNIEIVNEFDENMVAWKEIRVTLTGQPRDKGEL